MSDRNKEIYQDRKSGMTVKMITEKYNISITRAYQIFGEQQEEEALSDNRLFNLIKEAVPDKYFWIWNILKRSGVTTLEELQKLDAVQIKRIRGCGAKAINIIQQIKERDA